MPYDFARWIKARVSIDYHVQVEDHLYSVPYQLLGQEVDVRIGEHVVEVFHAQHRVASHLRSTRKLRHTTQPEHMPEGHRQYQDWNPQRFLRWAAKMGPSTAALIQQVLASRPHPEQGYRACLGILGLARKHGDERLEAACQHALAANAATYRSLKNILDNKIDQLTLQLDAASEPIQHPNIRGAHYYRTTEREP